VQPLFKADTGEHHCAASDDSYVKEKLEKLEHKIERVQNSTEGKNQSMHIHLLNLENLM
jgi:hypothetical protein